MIRQNYITKFYIISFFVFILISSQNSVILATSVKHNEEASKGCNGLASFSQSLIALEHFNFTTVNATKDEIVALGTGLLWLEKLNSGKPLDEAIYRGVEPYPFIFKDAGNNSRQTTNAIIIARKGDQQFGENVAQLIHELGHLVGQQGGYAAYRAHNDNWRCVVSEYSNNSFNEQFAEVFAAFVTQPSIIKYNLSPGCRGAWNFFSKKFFSSGEKAQICIEGKTNLKPKQKTKYASDEQSYQSTDQATHETVNQSSSSSTNIRRQTLIKRSLYLPENSEVLVKDFCDSDEPWIIKKCSRLSKQPTTPIVEDYSRENK